VKSPVAMIANRDFLTIKSSCKLENNEYCILLKSVQDERIPHRKGFVRAHVFLTGYLIQSNENGCVLHYLTQTDFKGKIPAFAVNFITKKYSPKFVKQMMDGVKEYKIS
jgi:hypothetical protein